jgi:nitroreductase
MNRILNRTSCRSYLDKPIEQEKIEQLKAIINHSPTAMNRQDFSCIFVTDKNKIANLSGYAGGQKHILEAPLFLVFYADQNRKNSASI